jgi:hypothetical protein
MTFPLAQVEQGDPGPLRTNSLSVIAKLPGRQNAELVVRVLENDPKVRRLVVASEISRLTQLDWTIALNGADDPATIPSPRKLAAKLAKGAISPKGTESRWACTYLLTRMVPVLGRQVRNEDGPALPERRHTPAAL